MVRLIQTVLRDLAVWTNKRFYTYKCKQSVPRGEVPTTHLQHSCSQSTLPHDVHICRKGFSKGGMGKQGELMELMAKAKQDRLKKELEEKMRESGDLPPAQEGVGKVTSMVAGARQKPERSALRCRVSRRHYCIIDSRPPYRCSVMVGCPAVTWL